MSVNPEETVCGGETVTETDMYLCFGKSIEELYAHNPQQQKLFPASIRGRVKLCIKISIP
jgi:hypothetical protein